jgi:hypothetical protein
LSGGFVIRDGAARPAIGKLSSGLGDTVVQMDPLNLERCVLCQQNLREKFVDLGNDVYCGLCDGCGKYEVSFEAVFVIRELNGDSRPWLRSATRQHWDISSKPLRLTQENVLSIPAQHQSTSVSQNVDKLMAYLVRQSPRPAARVRITQEQDCPIIDVRDGPELLWYLEYLVAAGFIKAYGPDYALTFKGWEQALGTSANAPVHGSVFVAMWFDPSMNLACNEGIRPALSDAGYLPICLKDVFLTEDINFRVLMEIRKAQFTVADITGAAAAFVCFTDSAAKIFFTREPSTRRSRRNDFVVARQRT